MGLLNSTQKIIRDLEREFGAYMCWNVPHAVGPSAWCAKRHDGRGKPLKGLTPEQLREYITAEIDELSDEPFGTPPARTSPSGRMLDDSAASSPADPAAGWLR